ncbi:MAG: type II toxin-antitoxin system VapC family toxin [Vicingaceae bacterium]
MSKSVLIDSNIIIYSAIPSQNKLRLELKDKKITASVISKVEVLGYHNLIEKEKKYFESFFKLCLLFPIHTTYIEQAIKLRQEREMSVGDALIASTAIIEGIPLITANTKDFSHISKLEIINPIA